MKKRNVLLSSIITIALCLSVIAGSTFALFTDSTQFNIAVTSGDVEILATAKVNSIYSAVKNVSSANSDEYLVDEFGKFYTHEKQTDRFINGGVAYVDNSSGNVVIERITPGDKVNVDINIDNTSNVAIAYRYIIKAEDTNLATGMVVTTFSKDTVDINDFKDTNNTSTEALAIWTSSWYYADAAGGTADQIPTRTVSIELPVYAGNEYQSEAVDQDDGRVAGVQSVEYTVIVEAVQSNANIDMNAEDNFVVFESKKENVQNTPPVLSDHFDPVNNAIVIKDLYLTGAANITLDANNKNELVLENVTADVDGSVIILDASLGQNPAIIIQDCDFILDAGEYIIDASAIGSAYQVFLANVTVNGQLLPIGTCDPAVGQYLNNVSWFQVVDPNLITG